MKLNRFQAFRWHLFGSMGVGLVTAALVFLVWYPWPLPAATGVTAIFVLLLAVDVVMGPCITLVVFNPAKMTLRFDMTVVLLLQISALLYGLHAVFVARPVYMVFNSDRFDLVYANDLTPKKLEKVSDDRFRSLPWLGVEVIAVRKVEDPNASREIIFSALMGGDDVPQLPQYYIPYAEQKAEVPKRIQPLEKLADFNKDKSREVDRLITAYASPQDKPGFLPLKGKIKDLTVVVRRDSAEVVEVVDLKPW